ncbi:MAG: lipopolysaccharide biosynthesis protein [Mariniblastus sp.]
MKLSEKQIVVSTPPVGPDSIWESKSGNEPTDVPSGSNGARGLIGKLFSDSEFGNVFTTFLTTLSVFGIYLVQGVFVARILGPVGRGEFGTAMFFPRDVFLYAGLLGGIEVVNSCAVKGTLNVRSLKYSAAKVGLISGVITGIVAAVISVVFLASVGKTYVIPFALLCCLFVPFEHMQLTISAVDRGSKNFRFYNINRLLFAVSFVCLVAFVFGTGLNTLVGVSSLTIICFLFVFARIVGIIPTLRGMDVMGTLFSKDATGVDDEVSSASVPGAWTLLKNGRFYALSMLASEMFERLDIFLIVAIASVESSGFYFVAVPAAQLLTVAPNALGVFTFNAGADKECIPSIRKVLTVMLGTTVLQVVSAIVLAVLIPFLIVTLFEDRYEPAILFALWLLPACAIKGYLQTVDGYLKGRDKPMVGVWARFLSIFVMLGFVGLVYGNVIAGPEQQLLCIPIAAGLGQAVSMVIISVAVIRDTIDREHNSLPPTAEAIQ